MLIRVINISIIFLLLITSVSASVTEVKISPEDPVVGDTIVINGKASASESITININSERNVTPVNGNYEYIQNEIDILSTPNNFKVIANGVNDLNVKVELVIWIPINSASATGGVAEVSQSNVPVGTYNIKIDGTAPGETSSVNLDIFAEQVISADSNGNFEYSYDTDAMPAGEFNISIGNYSEIINLNSPPPTPKPSARNRGSSRLIGGGTSGESYDNIQISETQRELVYKDSEVIYTFNSNDNDILQIKFISLANSGTIAATVEILEGTSEFVDIEPPGISYQNLNIYIGDAGWANQNRITDTRVKFKVKKSWVHENNINELTINLYKYSDGKWIRLVTDRIDQDDYYLYFESETLGFSSFAITGEEISGTEEEVSTNEQESGINLQQSTEKKRNIPGFSLLTTVVIMTMLVQFLRKKLS